MPTSLNFSQVFPQVFLSFPQLFRRTQGMDRLSPGTPASFAASSSPGASAADAPGLPPGLQEPNEETETLSWIIWIFGHIYACICVIKCLCIYIYMYVCVYICIYTCVCIICQTHTNIGNKTCSIYFWSCYYHLPPFTFGNSSPSWMKSQKLALNGVDTAGTGQCKNSQYHWRNM